MVGDCWPGSVCPPAARTRGAGTAKDGGRAPPLPVCQAAPFPGEPCLSGGAPPVLMPGSFEHWSIVITRPVRRVAQAAVVTTLVAGAVGVSYYDKSVNLSVDG